MNDLPESHKDFEKCLDDNGPVALIIKQYLRPVEGRGEIIFPPTYPMPTYKGRVHTVRDGEYRVSVELPPFRYDDNGTSKKNEEDGQSAAGYNIDEFKDGSNMCEIDSPQSQANRLEPLFKTIKNGSLVPQITFKVGNESVNLLDAGHRAADAVVRLSSMVAEFHSAFEQVGKGNHVELARIAPTSLLFGVWDSRGTQVKLPRLIKAEIRATNVKLHTRSAQFNPAIDYLKAGAVDENHDKGSGEKNPLSAEGMKHVPAPRAIGGVSVLGDITRVVRLNLVALRDLQAFNENRLDTAKTKQLQRYVLGLALVAVTHPLKLFLREGCLLCQDKEKQGSSHLVMTDGEEQSFQCVPDTAQTYAEQAAKEFFGDEFDLKNHDEARFETGVANKYLSMPADDRKKIARGGPITENSIRQFEEKCRDPLKLLSESIKEAKSKLPKKSGGKKNVPVILPDFFEFIKEQLNELVKDEDVDTTVHQIVKDIKELIHNDSDTHSTWKDIDARVREFKKQRKESLSSGQAAQQDEVAPQ